MRQTRTLIPTLREVPAEAEVVSHKLLLRAGMVTRRPNGRQAHYRIVDPFVDDICNAICGSIRAHVDRQAQRLPAALGRRRPTATSPRSTTMNPLKATTTRRQM